MNRKYETFIKKQKKPSLKKVYRRKYAKIKAIEDQLSQTKKDDPVKRSPSSLSTSLLVLLTQIF